MKLFCIALMLTAMSTHAAKGYHLWYDDEGNAVYSQFAPPNQTPSTLIAPPPDPAEPAEVAEQRLQEQLQRVQDNREDRALAAKAAADARLIREQAEKRCSQARHNLGVLQGQPRAQFRDSDGSLRFLTPQEQDAQRLEMEQIIARDCPS